jgi:hypothetical protein
VQSLWKSVWRFLKKLKIARHQWLAYNPSYSGGRDQEDPGLKPALANSETLSWKIPNTKNDWRSDSSGRALALQTWSPVFKCQSNKKKLWG